MSHGVSRAEYAALAASSEHQTKEAAKIAHYNGLVAQLQAARASAAPYTPAALELTAAVLKLNPEFYTVWNYRRQVLQHTVLGAAAGDADALAAHLAGELAFLFPLMKAFPKCYWLWAHRLWAMDAAPAAAAARFAADELALVARMLQRDVRNFHAWQYRRMVVARLEAAAAAAAASRAPAELAYTTQCVRVVGGLGNYSAWHARSTLLPRVLAEKAAGAQERVDALEDELALLAKTIATDPEDQSLWFYHAWLVRSNTLPQGDGGRAAIAPGMARAMRVGLLREEVAGLVELLESHPRCRFILKALVGYVGILQRVLEEPLEEGDEEDEDGNEGEEEGMSIRELLEARQRWLEKLVEVDPMRSGRYRDMGYGQ